MGCEENKLIAFLSILYECGKRRVFPYADIFPVIKTRTFQASIVSLESQRMYQDEVT